MGLNLSPGFCHEPLTLPPPPPLNTIQQSRYAMKILVYCDVQPRVRVRNSLKSPSSFNRLSSQLDHVSPTEVFACGLIGFFPSAAGACDDIKSLWDLPLALLSSELVLTAVACLRKKQKKNIRPLHSHLMKGWGWGEISGVNISSSQSVIQNQSTACVYNKYPLITRGHVHSHKPEG